MKLFWIFSVCLLIISFMGCGKSNSIEPEEPQINFSAKVLDAIDSTVISEANVVVFDANTNSPVTSFSTNELNDVEVVLPPGTYYVKITAQGYQSSPTEEGRPLSFQIDPGGNFNFQVFLDSLQLATNLSSVTGTIRGTIDSLLEGVLIIMTNEDGSKSYSTSSGEDGKFHFHNVEIGEYKIFGYFANSNQVGGAYPLSITGVTTITGVEFSMSTGATGTVTGQVSFVAVNNPDEGIDVSLIHPNTNEAIPGLNSLIGVASGDYSIPNIPNGDYIVWASYRNDGYVIDPDWIFMNGLPLVTFSETETDTIIRFKVTGAISLDSPTNDPDSIFPVEIVETTPIFVWRRGSSYSSAKEFIVSVTDANGELVWGGFDSTGVIRHDKIGPRDTTVVFNFDGSAVKALEVGNIYQWKVYADDDAAVNVQTLISSSEDLMGLFKVVAPPIDSIY